MFFSVETKADKESLSRRADKDEAGLCGLGVDTEGRRRTQGWGSTHLAGPNGSPPPPLRSQAGSPDPQFVPEARTDILAFWALFRRDADGA